LHAINPAAPDDENIISRLHCTLNKTKRSAFQPSVFVLMLLNWPDLFELTKDEATKANGGICKWRVLHW
jgi:hypothetical protein